MTTTAKTLPVKGTLESVVLGFNFAKETIGPVTNPSFQIFVESSIATDAAPTMILDGDPEIDVTWVYQRIDAGVDNVNYRIQCTADTPEGDRITIPVIVPVRLKP